MSWHYLQELVVESSEVSYSDGGQYALWKSSPTVGKCCSNIKGTGCYPCSQSGTTLEPLMGDLGVEKWISSLEDSRAKTSVSQERVLGLKEKEADSGKKWQGLYVKYGHDLFSSKIVLCSEQEDLQRFSKILPKQGMMQDGVLSELKILEPHTRGIESWYWATPTTMDSLPSKSYEALYKEATVARPGRSKPSNLRDQVLNMDVWQSFIPTPDASMGSRGPAKIWDAKSKKQSERNLNTFVKFFPTPTASMYKGASENSLTRKDGRPRENDRLDFLIFSNTGGGRLNPTWVEWLMGWPLHWTSLFESNSMHFKNWVDTVNTSNALWWSDEKGVSRVLGKDKSNFVKHRLKAIGNGQVPSVVVYSFKCLLKSFEKYNILRS